MDIIHGDCQEVMKTFSNNHIDFIVTDPPYGLSFMNKEWDTKTPSQEIWKEAIRICKPGAMLAAFGGSRTHHHLMISLEKAGWEIRDVIMWLYGSGFPKSHNHFGLEGYGTALKPAYEPIIICMKPLEGTYKQNVEKWGIGGINIDESRIPTNDKLGGGQQNPDSIGKIHEGFQRPWMKDEMLKQKHSEKINANVDKSERLGRWPANIILDEEAASMLDEQAGILKSGSLRPLDNKPFGGIYQHGRSKANINQFEASSGVASRFFYCAKASSAERNRGLEGMPLKQSNPNFGSGGFSRPKEQPERETKPCQNFHPTVKPISLMKYIIKLLAPPNNPILLDPFCGSGSTLIAAKELGINFIGIEISKEYCEIAEKRVANAKINQE